MTRSLSFPKLLDTSEVALRFDQSIKTEWQGGVSNDCHGVMDAIEKHAGPELILNLADQYIDLALYMQGERA